MAFGGQTYSIRDSGTLIFGRQLNSSVGGVLVDLATAPIPPGDYQLNVETGAGGIEIFLPHYAQFVVNGGTGFGGQNVHRGSDVWHKLIKKLDDHSLPANPTAEATREPSSEYPVRIQLNLHTGLGGVDIYQL